MAYLTSPCLSFKCGKAKKISITLKHNLVGDFIIMSTRYKRTNWVQQREDFSSNGSSRFGLGPLLLAWLFAGFLSSVAYAVPMTTTYQGYLENAEGEPLNATVNMTFALYATAQGGNAFWSETHQQIEVTNGVFNVTLGSQNPFTDDSLEGERYLGVTVGTDPEMSPRQPLTSAFFAMRAGVADSVKAAAVTSEAIAEGAVTADKIAAQTITGDKIAAGVTITAEERQKLEGLVSGGGSGGSPTFENLNVKKELKVGEHTLYLAGDTQGGQIWATGGQKRLALQSNGGNVGIGTTEPQAKLHVNGTIITQKLATKESQKEIVISVGGNNLFKISRTLSTHPDHGGVYERRLELLGPDDDSQDLGKTSLYGGISLFGDKQHSSVGIGPSISFHSTFPNSTDNRHFYISLGDTWNNPGVSKNDVVFHSWNHLYNEHEHIRHLVLKANGNVGIGTNEPQAKLHVDGTIITQKLATKESQKEIVISVGGNNLFKISRTLSTHPAHGGVYERRLELLGPDDDSQDLGKTSLYGGISLFGDKQHSSVGIGPSISFHSTFPNSTDNRHFYISLGDTWNNPGVSKNDVVFHSWNHLYNEHIQHLVLKANGNVGIGTITPQYKLDVAGTIRGNNVSPSDQRLKQNIQPLENSLAKVEQLRGVSFEWKDKAQDAGSQVGMIAQEVETVLPELVSTDSEGYKSLAYDKMTAILVEAVKELKAQNEALKAQNDAIKAIVCEDHPEKAICQ
jgi:hypothetical protein